MRAEQRPALVLGSGGVSRLAERSTRAAALVRALIGDGLWPPVVPSAVLVECLSGRRDRDVATNRLLRGCDVVETLPEWRARRAAQLRAAAGRGSAVDAVVVASAEPGGTVLTGDVHDIGALADHAAGVAVVRA